MKYEPKIEKEMMCPIEYGLDKFGGRWKSRILCVLSSSDVLRYGEIRKELSNISDTVLAAMLKELIDAELVSRKQYEQIPPKVEYALTDKGRSVLPILQSICQWSRENSAEALDTKLPSCQSCPQLY